MFSFLFICFDVIRVGDFGFRYVCNYLSEFFGVSLRGRVWKGVFKGCFWGDVLEDVSGIYDRRYFEGVFPGGYVAFHWWVLPSMDKMPSSMDGRDIHGWQISMSGMQHLHEAPTTNRKRCSGSQIRHQRAEFRAALSAS